MFERIQIANEQSGFRAVPVSRMPMVAVLLLTLGCGACAAALPPTPDDPVASPVAGQATGKSANPAANDSGVKATLSQTYGKLPMSFEPVEGGSCKGTGFRARGNGYGLYLTGQEAVLVLRKTSPVNRFGKLTQRLSANGIAPRKAGSDSPVLHDPGTEPETAAKQPPSTTDVLRMQLAGANPQAGPVGQGKLPGTVNYFIGNDPAKWRSAVPTFSQVKYNSVYPGVDLVYYGNQRQLEYDFVVAAGASAKPIRLRFSGARQIAIDAKGDLSIVSENGSIAFHRPVVYQTVAGSRIPVMGSFKLLADSSVGFSLGHYDRSKPLVIDPILTYSTFLGGSSADFVVAGASDSAGNLYVTGLTASEDFPLTAGAFQSVNYATPSNGVSTAFISKLNASGTALLYSTFVGGIGVPQTLHNQGDYGKAIAIDGSGNAYVTGYTYSSNFPITSGAFQSTNKAAVGNLATGFVTKLNSSGTALIYSTYLGGSTLEQLTGIALDGSDDAYVAGVSASSDYPVTSGVVQKVNNSYAQSGFNYVITKVNPSGSALIYSTYLGGANDNASGDGAIYWTNPIAVDKSGDAYVSGFTNSPTFPTTKGAYQTASNGEYTVTVSKLNPTATALLYSTYLGGKVGNTMGSISEGLAVDSEGNAYVAGYTSETDFPVTTGAFQTVNKASTDLTDSADANQNGFVTKINPTGTGLVYSTYLGGTTGPEGGDQIYEMTLDSAGDVYVAGSATSVDFPVTANAYQSKNAGATSSYGNHSYTSNAFVTELNPGGTALIYSSYLGGEGTYFTDAPGGYGDTAYGMTLGPNENVYIFGFTSSPNFPVTTDAFNTTYKTAQNIGFIADFDLGTAPTTKDTDTTLSSSANSVAPGTSLTFTAKVTAASGTTIPTGSIVFTIDEATVSTVALNGSGAATYSTASLPAGEHYVVASYGGSTSFASSGDGLNEYVTPVTPVVLPKAGTYTSQQTVTITEPTAGTALYYTADGTAPSRFTTPYTVPIVINTSKTISAVGVAENDSPSVTVTNAYTIVGSPIVLAAAATAVATPKATLNAFANTSGLAGTYYFQYGTSSSALTTLTAKTALAASTTRTQVSAQLATLAPKTTYYFQVVVITAGGTTMGSIQSFTTN